MRSVEQQSSQKTRPARKSDFETTAENGQQADQFFFVREALDHDLTLRSRRRRILRFVTTISLVTIGENRMHSQTLRVENVLPGSEHHTADRKPAFAHGREIVDRFVSTRANVKGFNQVAGNSKAVLFQAVGAIRVKVMWLCATE